MDEFKPNLVDNAELMRITQVFDKLKQPNQSTHIKNIFGFFDTYNRDTIIYIFTTVFFILIAIFLYLRYKNKQQELTTNTKIQTIDTFVVNNTLL